MRYAGALRVLALLGALFAQAGCDYQSDKVSSDVSPLNRSVGFGEVRQKVLQPSCTRCHTTQNPQLSDYADAAKAAAAIRRAVFADRTMPRLGQLSTDQKQLLLAWLDQGAPEGEPVAAEPDPDSTCQGTPVKVVWADVKTKVLDVACNGCHFPGNTGSISDLTNKDYAKSDIGSIVGLSLENMMPPPENAKPLTVEQKRLLTEWWIAGTPDSE